MHDAIVQEILATDISYPLYFVFTYITWMVNFVTINLTDFIYENIFFYNTL
jgi:hypothetical protein